MSLPKGAATKSMSHENVLKTPFVMFQAHKDDYEKMSQNILSGVQQESLLSKVFFHPKNVDLLQKQIIMEIFKRSDGEYLIERQNEQDLTVVMRSIFLQYAKHSPHNIRQQIKELDNIVTEEVVPDIMSEIKAYFGYLESVFGERKIMDLPISTSIAGLKTLPAVNRSLVGC